MPHYRVYTITADNRISGPPATINCDNDGKAIATARSLMIGSVVELWERDRCVARLEADKTQLWAGLKLAFGRQR